MNVLEFFSLLFLSLLDQAALPLTGPLWQLLTDPLNSDWIFLHFYPLYLVGLGSGDTKWSWFPCLFEVISIPSSAAHILKLG